jgi:hypothetical protein
MQADAPAQPVTSKSANAEAGKTEKRIVDMFGNPIDDVTAWLEQQDKEPCSPPPEPEIEEPDVVVPERIETDESEPVEQRSFLGVVSGWLERKRDVTDETPTP